MKKIILLVQLFAVLSIGTISAQDHFDALRFSQNFYEGTARFTSMGGAFAALGGDFTSLSINPAGIGVYRGIEFSMTPAISYSRTSSAYENVGGVKDTHTKFGFSNMGFVSPVYISSSSKGLVNMNVAVGYNKMNNFNSSTSSRGRNIAGNHSLLDNIVYQANTIGYHVDELTANNPYDSRDMYVSDWPVILAWQSNLLTNTGTNSFDSKVTYGDHNKFAQTVSEGAIGEYVISFGGNISHKFYFGFTMGIQDVDYESNRYYQEAMINPVDLNSFSYRESFRTNGTGYNFKAGVIYRPIPSLRLAFAAHTPTYFYLTDEYNASMRADISGFGLYGRSSATPTNFYDYRINSPYKLIFGGAYTFKSYGLISVDYELVDYSSMRLKEDTHYLSNYNEQAPFYAENQMIKNTFRAASNFRVGIEGNLPWRISLRAGYGYYGSPYKSSAGKDTGYYEDSRGNLMTPTYSMGIGNYTSNVYSAGIGYRFKVGFIDFAYSLTETKVNYALDSYNEFGVMDGVETKTNFNRFALTLGFKF